MKGDTQTILREFHFSLVVFIEYLLGRRDLHVTIIFFACMTDELASIRVLCKYHVLQIKVTSERYVLFRTGCLQHFQNYDDLMICSTTEICEIFLLNKSK